MIILSVQGNPPRIYLGSCNSRLAASDSSGKDGSCFIVSSKYFGDTAVAHSEVERTSTNFNKYGGEREGERGREGEC